MTRRDFPGASYIDALPTGEYVALYEGSHFQTHLGRIELPPGEPFGLLFVRCSRVGGFHFAGKGHDSTLTWEWHGAWRSFMSGTGRGCYDTLGVFRDTIPAGLQYCSDSGALISRIETYPPRDGLSEWTIRGDLRIGQGHDGGGVRVFADGALRELEPGHCIFINANRDGERLAVSFWNVTQHAAVIWQITLHELAAMPAVRDVRTPVPDPRTPTTPEPEPIPMSWPDISATLHRLRDGLQKDKLTADECVALLDAAASEHDGFGLLRKDGGNHGRQPGTGIRCSVDWLLYQPTGVGKDVLGDAGDSTTDETGPARVAWGEPEPADMSRFVKPSRVTQPEPEPEPQPGRTLEQRVEAIEAWIRRAL